MKPPTADGQPPGAPPVACVVAGAAPPLACVVVCVVVVLVVVGAVVVCTVVVMVVPAVVVGVLACVVTGGGVSVAPLSFEPLEPQAPTASAASRPSGSARAGARSCIGVMLASGVGGTGRGAQPEPVASLPRLRYARVPGASQWVGRSFELRLPVERRQGGANDAMSVKYAVLGLLAQRRGYGYDLVQRFEEQVGPAWQLNAGAIYVALDKLEQEGLVKPLGDGADQPVRRRTARGAPRVIYEATPQGLERFEDWMATGTSMAPLREELHLKLALSQPRNLARLIELTYEQEEACLERLEQHRGGTALDLLASAQPWSDVASVMVRDAEIAHLQATVHWLRSIREAMRWLQERPEALRSRS